mmetsp:Transcript_20084/g.55895  ORF Transcript_20084/g.55895 Transcript_20084/m.55895 type:complete len:612 (-) Transcript_20084:204-2039(-)|eukprot:CAMPEP_0198119882 /NCGR_PEP_ID=MMETSP1442-20131203/27304_1 /TAXON_ID= /ORGANISM="Craspedostauros australis, Strain CCMP3328" /LENGTH=611 /DNA_ID=CAMNT_0043778437 /DNA_START=144 /DNA_END=1979 /DNA_ORIENTATION=-
MSDGLNDPLLDLSNSTNNSSSNSSSSNLKSNQTNPGNHALPSDPLTAMPARTSIFSGDNRRRRQSFVMEVAQTEGPVQLAIVTLLYAFAFGCVISVVPAVMTDQFARFRHGYDGTCSAIHDASLKPSECLWAAADAQDAAATESLISNIFTFLLSSWIGSLSDELGRRRFLLIGMGLSTLGPIYLVITQLAPSSSPPSWYYTLRASTGLINWIAIAISAISDVIPTHWRAPAIGLFLCSFMLGLSLAPTLALFFDNFQLSVLSATLLLIGAGYSIFFLPETLPPHAAHEAKQRRLQEEQNQQLQQGAGSPIAVQCRHIFRTITNPMRTMTILNRNNFFRLLSILAFFSGMVTSADQTLLVYYVEDTLSFTAIDISHMFLIIGGLGMLSQAVLLKPLNDCLGEKLLITCCFVVGSIQNVLYGIATDKASILWAVTIGSFSSMSFPVISAIKANNVSISEQGQIQGALYSLQALASGVGPVFLRYVDHVRADDAMFGEGTMFVAAGALYLFAVAAACALPADKANSRNLTSSNDPDGSIGHVGNSMLVTNDTLAQRQTTFTDLEDSQNDDSSNPREGGALCLDDGDSWAANRTARSSASYGSCESPSESADER